MLFSKSFYTTLLASFASCALFAASATPPQKAPTAPVVLPIYNNNFFFSGDFLYWLVKPQGFAYAEDGLAVIVPGVFDYSTGQPANALTK